MSGYREFRDQIRCLGLDSVRMTLLGGGAELHNVAIEVADRPGNPLPGEPVLVSLTPHQARELASSLWWLADRSGQIAAGIR